MSEESKIALSPFTFHVGLTTVQRYRPACDVCSRFRRPVDEKMRSTKYLAGKGEGVYAPVEFSCVPKMT